MKRLIEKTVFFGFVIAFLAIDSLFSLNLMNRISTLSILSFYLLFPMLIISGLSKSFTFHANKIYYPKDLKNITQYAFLPIITLYALILIVYVGKIIITGIWPSGWTVGLYIGYSSLLLLSIILTYPVLFNDENKRLLQLIFVHLFLALLFQIVYYVAIIKRINEYGLTENRIFTLLYGLWILIVVIHFIVKKINDLRIVPFTLLVILLLSVTGPWNVFRICKSNQTKRMINIAQQANIIVNGKINAKNKIINHKTQSELSSIALYLVETHGPKSIQSYFPVNVDSVFSKSESITDSYSKLETIFQSSGLTFSPYSNNSEFKYKSFYTEHQENAYPVNNALFVCIFNFNNYVSNDTCTTTIHYKINDTLSISLASQLFKGSVNIYINNQEDAVLWLSPYYDYLKELKPVNQNYFKHDDLKAKAEGKRYNYTFYFTRIEFQLGEHSPRPVSIDGLMFVVPISK